MIHVRSNVDSTFYSIVGSRLSGGDHNGVSLLENPYIKQISCYGLILKTNKLAIPKNHIFNQNLISKYILRSWSIFNHNLFLR